MNVNMYVCMHLCMYVCIHKYMYVYMFCIYVYIPSTCTYIVQGFTQRPRNGRIKLCNCANREVQLNKF